MSKQLTVKIVLAVVIFVASAASYAYPVMKKGYAPWSDDLTLIEARDKGLANTYSYESSKGVFLSSTHAGETIVTGVPNPLTAVIYGEIFKVAGFKVKIPELVSIVLFAAVNVLLFLLVAELFSVEAGFFGAIVSALMPIVAAGAVAGGFYEFALLFFTLGLWCYVNPKKLFRASVGRLVLASALFALAALARNAFAVSFVPFFCYDLYVQRSWKKSLAFLAPFVLIFGLTLTSFSWLGVPNGYTATVNQPFQQVGHVFNDPYSYYYNRDASVQQILSTPGALDRVAVKFLGHFGYKITLKQDIKAMFASAVFYVSEMFDLVTTGGFFILLLAAWGAYLLYKSNRPLFYFFATWLVMWLGYLVVTESGNGDHFIELGFLFASLAGLGAAELAAAIQRTGIKRILALAVVALALVGHLSSADKWKFFDAYRSSVAGKALDMVAQTAATPYKGVVAIGIHPDAAYDFAYTSNRDTVYFQIDTINDLLKKGTLKQVFGMYNIGIVAGFDPVTSAQIKSMTGLPVVALTP